MKAITTTYHGPTATRSAHISAKDGDGNRARIGYEEMTSHEPGEPRHRAAALALCAKMEWDPADLLPGGWLGGNSWAFVFRDKHAMRTPEPETHKGKPACIHLFNDGAGAAAGVRVHQTGVDRFTVAYGLQVRKGLNYTAAAHEFGECVFHALACDGKLDNR